MLTYIILFLFWPCMLASVIGSIAGVIIKSHRLLFICAVLIIPMSLYIATFRYFLVWGLVFPLSYAASAIYIKKNKVWIAIAFCLPVYGVIGWLGYVVLNQ